MFEEKDSLYNQSTDTQVNNILKYINQPTIKLQIDRNFILIIQVRLKGLVVNLYGSILHKNCYPLKLSTNLWNVIQKYHSLQKCSSLFQYSFETNTFLIISKFNITNFLKDGYNEEIQRKKRKMHEDARRFISKSYKCGLMHFSNKNFLQPTLENALFKNKLINDFFQEKNQIQKAEKLQYQFRKPSVQFPIAHEKNNQIQEKPSVILCSIQQIQSDQNNLEPQQIEPVEKKSPGANSKIKSNLIAEGGFFLIERKVCKLRLIVNSQNQKQQYLYQKNNSQLQTKSGFSNQYYSSNITVLAKKTLKIDRKKEIINNLKLQKELLIVNQIKNNRNILTYYLNISQKKLEQFLSQKRIMKEQISNQMNQAPDKKERSSFSKLTTAMKKIFFKKSKNEDKVEQIAKKSNTYQYLYMQYHPDTLNDFIRNQPLSLEQSCQITTQLIQSVLNLHESNIIHRDLKKENILMDFTSTQKQFILKIIDFSQSAIHIQQNQYVLKNQDDIRKNQIFESFNTKLYGATLPHSPPECIFHKQSRKAVGINNFKIDSWSIGMILFEVYHQRQAVNFSKPYDIDILKLMKDHQLNTYGSKSKKYGLKLFQSFINLLTQSNLVWNQQIRYSVPLMHRLNKIVQIHMKKLINKMLNSTQ